MITKSRLLVVFCIAYTALYGQVQLPYQLTFRDANAKSVAQTLLKGPWDQSIRCDALDTMRFLPTCCGGVVPFLGLNPYQFNCIHRTTQSGGDYLSLMRNYT
ncbi:MAG: hypothetical protein ACK45C_08260, partial [Bacteroidota bacterium]